MIFKEIFIDIELTKRLFVKLLNIKVENKL